MGVRRAGERVVKPAPDKTRNFVSVWGCQNPKSNVYARQRFGDSSQLQRNSWGLPSGKPGKQGGPFIFGSGKTFLGSFASV